jgi:hypothetical protein
MESDVEDLLKIVQDCYHGQIVSSVNWISDW